MSLCATLIATLLARCFHANLQILVRAAVVVSEGKEFPNTVAAVVVLPRGSGWGAAACVWLHRLANKAKHAALRAALVQLLRRRRPQRSRAAKMGAKAFQMGAGAALVAVCVVGLEILSGLAQPRARP